MPALDAWATLTEVLDALRPQVEGKDREALLIDSSGALSEADLQARWPWLRIIALPEPTLPGRARNIGASSANGEWLAFLDADCIPESCWLDRLEASLTGSFDAVAGGILNGTPRSAVGTTGYLLEFADWNPQARHAIRHAASCNLLIRRRALEGMGGFPEDVFPGEDTIVTVPIAAAGRLGFAPQARVRHINRTSLGEFLSHQLRFGRSFPEICARSKFPHRSLGRPALGPVAGVFRLLALGWRVIRQPRLALTALVLLPLIVLGLAYWTVGLTTSRRPGNRLARRTVAEDQEASGP
jgi:cellulose synthase/poly-beta-1,6-N-acetylglucosamine synthase-like glycosyltransferase